MERIQKKGKTENGLLESLMIKNFNKTKQNKKTSKKKNQ